MPLIGYADPITETIRIVRAGLTANALTATVGARIPFTRSLDSPSLPYVLVRVDAASSADRFATDERSTVRVAVWGTDEESAYLLARQVRAILLAASGDAKIRAFTPLAGVVPTSDPESGTPLSSFTVAALMRPLTL